MTKVKHYSVCWLGNAGWLMEIEHLRLLIDPDLEPGGERLSLPAGGTALLEKADAVLITHEHGDHFNTHTIRYLLENTHCRFVLAGSCLYKAGQMGIPEDRILLAHHEKTVELFGSDFTVTPKPAVHGAPQGAVYKYANRADCGYLLQTSDMTLFHPGDTVLLEEHFELPPVDILMVSPTEHNTNVHQSNILINTVMPDYIFPQHRDTYEITGDNYFWTRAYTRELYDALDEGFASRYHILEQGRPFVIR